MLMNRKIIMLLAIPLAIGFSSSQAAENAAKPATKPAANVADRSPEAVVNSKCIECHGTGKAHSPRIGDREEWTKRASKGLDGLVLGATRGHDGMPARGGRPDLTDAEFKAAIFYMFAKSVSEPVKK
ncbi:MAG: cytochrome c5 family protein [Betaproteobacteria bacterium]|nr:cytochrome c5 family protein [Betaproteobacteria bacterium]